jgi:hypothetical protein
VSAALAVVVVVVVGVGVGWVRFIVCVFVVLIPESYLQHRVWGSALISVYEFAIAFKLPFIFFR